MSQKQWSHWRLKDKINNRLQLSTEFGEIRIPKVQKMVKNVEKSKNVSIGLPELSLPSCLNGVDFINICLQLLCGNRMRDPWANDISQNGTKKWVLKFGIYCSILGRIFLMKQKAFFGQLHVLVLVLFCLVH